MGQDGVRVRGRVRDARARRRTGVAAATAVRCGRAPGYRTRALSAQVTSKTKANKWSNTTPGCPPTSFRSSASPPSARVTQTDRATWIMNN